MPVATVARDLLLLQMFSSRRAAGWWHQDSAECWRPVHTTARERGTTSASIGAASTLPPYKTNTPLLGAAGGLERAFWKGSAPLGIVSHPVVYER